MIATIVKDYGNGSHKVTFEGTQFNLDAMGRISWMSDWGVIDGPNGWLQRGLVREHCHGSTTYNHVTLTWTQEVTVDQAEPCGCRANVGTLCDEHHAAAR